MIIFVSTHSHRYTHAAVAERVPGFRRIGYPLLFARRSLPFATYIFSDFDRLNFWQLEIAAHVYRVLRDAACRVLNDPAKALHRLALLRRLNRSGMNAVSAWPVHDAELVDRFPVFLRTAAAHRGPLTDLLQDRSALNEAIEEVVSRGTPTADLIIVQYVAEPLKSGIFRKSAIYNIGGTLVPSPSVHQRHWTAKFGQHGAADRSDYAEDLERMRAGTDEPLLAKVFAQGNIEYGRCDYGYVSGRPVIYEINTNTMMSLGIEHEVPERAEAMRISSERYLVAMLALQPEEARAPIRIPRPETLTEWRRHKRLVPGYQWLP